MAILNILETIEKYFELMFGSSVSIEVQPQQLLSASQKLSAKASAMQYQLQDLSDRVTAMNRYWEGHVYNSRKESFQREFKDMESVIRAMEIYSKKLKCIAENYVRVEDRNNDSADALPMSIIS